MSGINGIFERRGIKLPENCLSASLQSLGHYGGDEKIVLESVALGYLAATADQTCELPFYNATERIALTMDARIDNRAELCETLGIGKTEQKNISNSRLIITAWRKWEEDCPRHIIGDYAFALWDESRQILFCARDHIGVTPFYYSLTTERFIFATEMQAVLAFDNVSDRLDEDYLLASIADKRFYRPERTYFAEVKRLTPGHSLTVKPDGEKLQRFWFPEKSKKIRFSKDEDYAEAAREIFVRAVNDRLQTKEKVGVHLSGGLDSGSVTVLTARERRLQGFAAPEVFSWQPLPTTEDISNEREYQNIFAVCRQENLTPQFCPINAPDILSILKKDPTREPIDITLLTETTIQKAAAKRGVRLLLSGWGGDESLSFEGRGLYGELLLSGRWWRLLRETRKHGEAIKLIAEEAILLLFPDRIEGTKKLANRSLRAGAKSTSFIREELKSKVKLYNFPCRQTSVRSTLFNLWSCGMLSERTESWAAHGARYGIAYAYPMLDRRLLEFVAGLPSEQFDKGRWSRRIMRQTMNGILPDEVCWQINKAEPVRVEKGLKAVYEAQAAARDEIESKTELPSRARYLDMKSLLKRLQPEVLAQRPQQAEVTRALQFLDF